MAGLISVLDSADLRRVDLAVDTFDGSVTHERFLMLTLLAISSERVEVETQR